MVFQITNKNNFYKGYPLQKRFKASLIFFKIVLGIDFEYFGATIL